MVVSTCSRFTYQIQQTQPIECSRSLQQASRRHPYAAYLATVRLFQICGFLCRSTGQEIFGVGCWSTSTMAKLNTKRELSQTKGRHGAHANGNAQHRLSHYGTLKREAGALDQCFRGTEFQREQRRGTLLPTSGSRRHVYIEYTWHTLERNNNRKIQVIPAGALLVVGTSTRASEVQLWLP